MKRLRPITKHEKRMWDLRHKPWAYEYKVEPAPLPQLVKHEKSAAGLFLLALLRAIINLPDPEESDIEDGGEIETPQNTLTAKS